ncbi:MAG: hypothetical protein O9256_00685 [Rhizobiaceae bacterium]|nr:hypothetical protein [Rhizobiaceae bacterium]
MKPVILGASRVLARPRRQGRVLATGGAVAVLTRDPAWVNVTAETALRRLDGLAGQAANEPQHRPVHGRIHRRETASAPV